MRVARAAKAIIAFTTAMLIVPLGGTTPAPAHAYEEMIRALDWNAAGNSSAYGMGTASWLSSKLGPYIQNNDPYPTIITLQEVCRHQVTNLFAALPTSWSTTSFAFWEARLGTDPTICNGNDYGNATLIWGGGSNSEYEFTNQDNPIMNPAIDEIRGIACVNGSIGGALNVSACSLHASAAYDSVANAQVAEAAADVSSAVSSGLQYLVAGDFNLNLADGPFSGLDAFYQNFDEGDQYSPPSNDATHDTEGKIDYVFLSRNTPGFLYDMFETATGDSDHHIIFNDLLINMPD